ncbi:porin [Ruegeria atlantica]|uniref:Porin n=1 Tax=Ruegeria atlantica TaxID=81569 RepID=A0AA90Z5H8_9RHOB|nr:porin [Ruegeria atlantica]NOE20586.1 porin [Ruegeria atlantica]
MKKVLFASTALIATAGVAAAEVNFSGYGRFGIGYQEDRTGTVTGSVSPAAAPTVWTTQNGGTVTTTNAVTADVNGVDVDDTILVSRFRLNIDGIVETDSGVRFEGRVRLQADENANGEAGEAGLNGARFSVIYGGLRVDAGNVAGSFDNLANYYGNEVGLELFAGQYSGVDYGFLAYDSTGSGSNGVFFQYSVGDFAFGASYDVGATTVTVPAPGTPPGPVTVNDGNDRWDISVAYTFNNVTAALAYGQTDSATGPNPSLTVLTLGAEFGDFSGTLFVADDDNTGATRGTDFRPAGAATDGTAWGLSAAYNLGAATTLLFTYGDGSADGDKQQIALGAIYDLGGGASLRGGIGRNDCSVCANDQIVADFGAQFNF